MKNWRAEDIARLREAETMGTGGSRPPSVSYGGGLLSRGAVSAASGGPRGTAGPAGAGRDAPAPYPPAPGGRGKDKGGSLSDSIKNISSDALAGAAASLSRAAGAFKAPAEKPSPAAVDGEPLSLPVSYGGGLLSREAVSAPRRESPGRERKDILDLWDEAPGYLARSAWGGAGSAVASLIDAEAMNVIRAIEERNASLWGSRADREKRELSEGTSPEKSLWENTGRTAENLLHNLQAYAGYVPFFQDVGAKGQGALDNAAVMYRNTLKNADALIKLMPVTAYPRILMQELAKWIARGYFTEENARRQGYRDTEEMERAAIEQVLSLTDWDRENRERLEEEGRKYGGAVRTAGEVLHGVNSMLPSLAASWALGSPNYGLAVTGAQAYGANAGESYRETGDWEQANLRGSLEAGAEIGIEKLSGGVPLLGEGVMEKALGAAGRGLPQAAQEAVRKLAESGWGRGGRYALEKGGEGLEEMISTAISGALERAAGNPEARDATAEEVLHSGLIGTLSAAVLGLPGDVVEALQRLRENDRIKAELKFFGKTVKGLSREEFEEALYRALAGEYTREEQSRPQSVVWSIPEAEFDELYRKAQNEELKTAEAWEAELARLRKRYGIPEPRPEEIPETETEGPEAEETPPESDRRGENKLKSPILMEELISSGVKCNIDDVIMVTKTVDQQLLWLEKGGGQSGFVHILNRHMNDFASQNINNIPQLLYDLLSLTPVNTGKNSKGLFADFVWDGHTYRVAYGTNGYIVSFYPLD